MNQLVLVTYSPALSALIRDVGEPAALRFLEFFAADDTPQEIARSYSSIRGTIPRLVEDQHKWRGT